MQRRHARFAGFTLLEVILSLALSGLLLGSLAWAIQLNLKATTSGRSDVARAQLARAALERMAGDIRAAVWYDPIDPQSLVVPPSVSSLSSNNSSGSPSGGASGGAAGSSGQPTPSAGSASAGGSGSSSMSGGGRSSSGAGSSSGGGSMGGGASSGGRSSGSSGGGSTASAGGGSGGASGMSGSGQGGSSSSSGSTSSSSTDPNATQPPLMPGLFGGTNWLQVDLSRLPRSDQYFTTAMATPGAKGMIRPSEIKSVYYYVTGSGQGLPPALSNASGASGGATQGLMRREADRLVTLWQTTGGGGQMTAGQAPEALAPEIEKLEFRYFNGSTYSNMWDSRQYGCLPRAVEIRITLADESNGDKKTSAARAPTRKSAELPVYTLLVAIPAWKPPKLQTTDPTQSSSTTGSSSTTSGASSTGSR